MKTKLKLLFAAALLATAFSCQKSKIEVDKTTLYYPLALQYGKEVIQISTRGEWWIEPDSQNSMPIFVQGVFLDNNDLVDGPCYARKKYEGDAKVSILYQINLDFPNEPQSGCFYVKNEKKSIKVDVLFR